MLIVKEDCKVQYNGQIKDLKAGQILDVRDFDIPNAGVKSVEKHIMAKNAGKLEITDHKGAEEKLTKAHAQEVAELKAALQTAQNDLAEVQAVNKQLSEKHSAAAGEVSEAKKEVTSIKKELTRLKKVNEDLEDEVQKLRLNVAQKGK